MDDSTDRFISVLEGRGEYVMAFVADFAGDISDYIELAEADALDPEVLNPQQVGEALRRFVEDEPPPDFPSDLDLGDVDWTAVGQRMDDILSNIAGS
jgi:hypothetical protein